ncbi:MAG: helix-turn-helix transcriptional regulator [Oscillospiraceae bacterium]|nr:helix-turn-helix transcriptional regulator [Kiritimatiellia bacterium]MBO7726921.1 helix-turn-helix transcriptional regulator [Oscillospiraceae bacterium]MBO7726993.1 helix-turn-helix transcriptional regulator [Oscillospiraceae bacterium]
MFDKNAIARNLRKHMEEKNISINKLARLADVMPSTVWQYIHGYSTPVIYNLYKISKVLGISVDNLIKGIDDGKED